MNWFGEYVIEPNGFIHWREGMRVSDPTLVEEFQRQPFIAFTLGKCSEFGVCVGEA